MRVAGDKHACAVPFESKLRFRDLEFDGAYVERLSSRGVPFPRWEPTGVPRISDNHLANAFYLYPTVQDAKAGTCAGGTGFIVTVDSTVVPGMGYNYAVTNYHVAIGVKGRGAPVIRLNTLDGGHDIIELGPEDWEFDPVVGADVVVARIKTNDAIHRTVVAPLQSFALKPFLEDLDVGPGDNVFMVGRFVDHDGGPTNRPAARFGHISIMPSPLRQEHSGKLVDAYCCDMNSRNGYSGSPVWVYRTPHGNLQKADYTKVSAVTTGGTFMMLLGIHYGQFPENWRIENGAVVTTPRARKSILGRLRRAVGLRESEPSSESLFEGPAVGTAQQIRGMSGMTCVLPVWHILNILNRPKFKDAREAEDRRMAEAQGGKNRPAIEGAA